MPSAMPKPATSRSSFETTSEGPGGEIHLTVTDDGRGATPQDLRRSAAGVGLIGMRERVYALSGRMTTESSPATGFRFTDQLPDPV